MLDLQTDRGEILWARHADGTPWSFALLTGSSSICHSLRCAIALAEHLGHERPALGAAAARLAHVIRTEPDAFAPKHRWAMDWYYPVLTGVVTGEAGRERLDERGGHLRDGGPGRALRLGPARGSPWPRPASACWPTWRSATGASGPSELFGWAQQYRVEGGRYWTGTVYPEEVHFPGGEQSTYTAAAVVLAADALCGTGPTANLFVDDFQLA